MGKIKIREPGEYLKNLSISKNDLNSSLLTSGIRNEIAMIKLEKIRPFKGQARIDFDDEGISALAETIRRHGVRQPLTLLSCDEDNCFEVVSGERRLRAAKLANLEKVPAIIIQNRELAEELALIENIHRKDLDPLEIGKSYCRLIETGLVTNQNELSQKIGVSKGQVSEYISFAKLPETIIQLVIKHKLSTRSFLRKLLSFNDEKKMNDFLIQSIKISSETKEGKEKAIKGGEKNNNFSSIKLTFKNNKWSIPSKANFSSVPQEQLINLKTTLNSLLKDIDKIINNEEFGDVQTMYVEDKTNQEQKIIL